MSVHPSMHAQLYLELFLTSDISVPIWFKLGTVMCYDGGLVHINRLGCVPNMAIMDIFHLILRYFIIGPEQMFTFDTVNKNNGGLMIMKHVWTLWHNVLIMDFLLI